MRDGGTEVLGAGVVCAFVVALFGVSVWYEIQYPCVRSELVWTTDTTCYTTQGHTSCSTYPVQRTVCLERTKRAERVAVDDGSP